jgi:putative zinc finger/helix-turn-helix YgiT family protein
MGATGQAMCPECLKSVMPRMERRHEVHRVRGDEIELDADVGVCPDCGADLWIDELDDATLKAAFDVYRERHHLTTPDQMRALRQCYSLGVRAFSLLLGWGELTMHRYERGSLQDAAHETQLKMVTNPANVRVMLQANAHKLTPRQRAAVESRLAGNTEEASCGEISERFVAREEADEYSGYQPVHLAKLREMMIFFAKLPDMYPTKLNKLLFYADFLHYKQHATSISGSSYLAFQYGPVPRHYERIKADLIEGEDLAMEEVDFGEFAGERLSAAREPDLSTLSKSEVATLESVARELGALSSKQLAGRSHAEKAFQETLPKEMISYRWAEELSV